MLSGPVHDAQGDCSGTDAFSNFNRMLVYGFDVDGRQHQSGANATGRADGAERYAQLRGAAARRRRQRRIARKYSSQALTLLIGRLLPPSVRCSRKIIFFCGHNTGGDVFAAGRFRVIDAFADALDLGEVWFDGAEPAATGRLSFHPSVHLKLYIHGYLNRAQSRGMKTGIRLCRARAFAFVRRASGRSA